jgi:hypothetical protein
MDIRTKYVQIVVKYRKIKLAGHEAPVAEMRNAYKILIGKHRRNESLEMRRRKWKRLEKLSIRISTGFIGLKIWSSERFL